MKANQTIRYNTLHINLWGTPGVGKSAVAAMLYAKLKEAGFIAALVQDYANELALQGKLAWTNSNGEIQEYDQFLISSEQYRRQSEMDGLLEVVITDSPPLQQTIFAPDHYAESLQHILNQLTVGWTNVDVLLVGEVRQDYSSMGRIKNVRESMDTRNEIEEILKSERPDYFSLSSQGAIQKLFDLISEHLARGRMNQTGK